MPEGGRDPVLPLTYRDPSPSESAPVPVFGISVFHSSVFLICQKPYIVESTILTYPSSGALCLQPVRQYYVQNPLDVLSFSAKYISTGRIVGAGVLGQVGQILA